MGRLTSYQKLKQRIIELEQDIYLLVEYGDSYPGQSIKTKWKTYFDLYEMISFGMRKQITGRESIGLKTGGFIEHIIKSENNTANHE